MGGEQGAERAARRAAGAEQEDASAGKGTAEVGFEVTQEAGSVAVVADDLAAHEGEQVDRAGLFGARRASGGQAIGVFFERHGNVGPTSSVTQEGGHGAGKIVDRCQARLVAQGLAGLHGKGGMNLR